VFEVQLTLKAIGSRKNCELIFFVHLHGKDQLLLGLSIARADDNLTDQVLKRFTRIF
jgi:hypothetical protein